MPLRKFLILTVIAFCVALPAGGQAGDGGPIGKDIDSLHATEVFRVGLEAYNRFSFNEAIFAFEQALSFKPGEPLLLDWLGKAYYRSGMEEIALRQWVAALTGYERAANEAVLINNRIEVISRRRSLFPSFNDNIRYTETGVIRGKYNNIKVFGQPTGLLACEDGSVWAAAYGSNEIILLDVNGIVRKRARGPLAGFDRPYDIARGLDERLYVSEFRGGRISVLSESGAWLSYIGKKGLNDGDLLGPAALTIDEEGYIYVSEYGNRRISKYSPDGDFINAFGKKDESFPGFKAPAGIVVKDDLIYAGDSIAKRIYLFDKNGYYHGVFQENIEGIESLKLYPDRSILVAATDRLLLIDTDSSIVREITARGNSRIRYVGGNLDKNGSILAANFNEDEISVLTSMDDLASGLFVQIERIAAGGFPTINLEVSVQNSNRSPIIGLDETNFSIIENGNPAAELVFLGSSNTNPNSDISIMLERSPEMGAENSKINTETALNDIIAALKSNSGNISSIVSAGEQPIFERFNADNTANLSKIVRSGVYTPRWRFDTALRLAATDLLPKSKKRAIIFISTGTLGQFAFEQYNLSELSAYMANNGIAFYCILIGDRGADEPIKYLCGETGGEVVRLYRPEGIGGIIKKVAETSIGVYGFSYKSVLPTDFGRAFLPIRVEVNLMQRTGRDEAGYFAPLQ